MQVHWPFHAKTLFAANAVASVISTYCAAAAIFDGHGGHSAADYMSKNLYKILSVSIDDETHETEGQVESERFLTKCIAHLCIY